MKCSICGIAVDSVDQAINNSWVPYFYEGDQEHEFACDGAGWNGSVQVEDQLV